MPARSSSSSWTLLLFLLPWAVVTPACNCIGDGAPDAGGEDGGAQGDAGHAASDAGDAGDAGAPGDGGHGLDGGGATADGGGTHDGGFIDAGARCADAGVTESSLTVTTSSRRLQGTTAGTSTGRFVLRSDAGTALEGPVPTAEGAYDVTVPLLCGAQTVELSWSEPLCVDLVRVHIERQACTATDLQVSLSWDALGLDFELHLVRQGGRINDNATDCTWTSCIGASPDWGVEGDSSDDPHKDVDNTGTFGPENIWLNRPEDGGYTVLVEHWGNGGALASGEVTILLAGRPAVKIPITHLASRWVDTVATIDWPTRTVTPVSTFTDCTGSWSSGCTLPLP